MLFFFGTRASRIGTEKVEKETTCPHCQSRQSFILTSFGKYFHFFFIPIIPLWKEWVVECDDCKKTFAENDLPEQEKSLVEEHMRTSPLGRPLWHCCGCFLIIGAAFLFFCLVAYAYLQQEPLDEETKARKTSIEADFKLLNNQNNIDNDSIANYLKDCIGVSIEGIETDEIKYFTKKNGDKLLVLLNVDDFKDIEKSSRRVLVDATEECLDFYFDIDSEQYNYFIGVDGRWNLLMVKTPFVSDLGGSLANKSDLQSFYDTDRDIPVDPVRADDVSKEIDSAYLDSLIRQAEEEGTVD